MDQRVVEICIECGNSKAKAVKMIKDEFSIGLVDAKKLADEFYASRINNTKSAKSTSFMEKRKLNKDLVKQQNIKHKDETKYDLQIVAGRELIKGLSNSFPILWRQPDGLLYFENDTESFYEVCGFVWDGPQYKSVTTSQTVGNEKGKQKRKGRFIGAAVGTVLLPGVGTVIGAAHGTGNKKSTKDIMSNTVISEHDEEVATTATLKLKNIASKEIFSLIIQCTSTLANKLSVLIPEKTNISTITVDQPNSIEYTPYEELKKLKELLDMDILTQEEFDAKKKQLLGL